MTAETAVVLPVVVLALALVLASGALTAAHVSCRDAARTAARVLARGDGTAEAVSAGLVVLGRPGTVSPGAGPGGTVRVVVSTQVRTPGAVHLPTALTTVSCSASTWPERRS